MLCQSLFRGTYHWNLYDPQNMSETCHQNIDNHLNDCMMLQPTVEEHSWQFYHCEDLKSLVSVNYNNICIRNFHLKALPYQV